jgi:hypothetical protein
MVLLVAAASALCAFVDAINDVVVKLQNEECLKHIAAK